MGSIQLILLAYIYQSRVRNKLGKSQKQVSASQVLTQSTPSFNKYIEFKQDKAMQFEPDLLPKLKLSNVQWKNLLVKTILWFVAEISLSYLEIDHLADYSEFIFERHIIKQPYIDTLV